MRRFSSCATAAAIALAITGETAHAQRFSDPPNWSEFALAATYGSTVAYDTTVTSLGVNGWVTWTPTIWSIDRVHVSALTNVELGWGKLARALPYNESDSHELLAFGVGAGVSASLGDLTEIGAHAFLDIESDQDYGNLQADAVEQWTLRLSARRGALRGRIGVPLNGQGFGSGRLFEAAVWRRLGGREVGLRYQRLSGTGPETITYLSLMVEWLR